MKEKDRERFLLAMAKTRVSLPTASLSPEESALRTDVFWEGLEGFSISEVEKALKRARAELKFFPRPIEIVNFILEDAEVNFISGVSQIEYHPKLISTEEAKEIIKRLNDHWAEEEQQWAQEKEERFQKNKENLKKQAKLLLS